MEARGAGGGIATRRWPRAGWPGRLRTLLLALHFGVIVAACGGGALGGAGVAVAAATALAVAADGLVAPTATQAPPAGAGAGSPVTTPPTPHWTPCATEGQTCAFSGRKQVRFGRPSQWVVLTLTGGTPCNVAVFKDPAPGQAKECRVAEPDTAPPLRSADWTPCAAKEGACTFTGTRLMRFGTATLAVTRYVTGGGPCSVAAFGDPAWGVAKSCWYATRASSVARWIDCATEGGRCAFAGARAVRYGTPTDEVVRSATGGVDCSNAEFGDPAYGQAKTCSYSSAEDTAARLAAPAPGLTVPAVTTGVLGVPVLLVATALDDRGAAAGGAAVTWTLADPTLASLDASGVATPRRIGFTTLTATAGSRSASGLFSVRGPTPMPTRSRYVGTNLGTVAYFGTNFPFADMMKSGGGWASKDNNGTWGAAFPTVSAEGYPTSLAPGQHALAPVAWSNTHYPAGQYVVLWDGDGTLSFPLSNVRIVASAAHRIVVEPTDLNGAIWVGIDATSPTNPVRNVRFLWPGTEATYATQPFNPTYLARIAPFSMLRFMDWGQTNGSPLVEWADRPLPTNVTFATPKGVPIEVMIDLANTLHVDPWFCIPHRASDDYVRKFATLLHTRLDPTLRPHVEYSNEVWNFGFSQTQWAMAQSDAKGLARPWGLPSIFYARRSVEIFKLVRQVWGDDAGRVVRVLSGHAAWDQFLKDALYDADTAASVDAVAIAPYFHAAAADDPANLPATLAATPDTVIDQMLANVRGPVREQMGTTVALATRFGLKVLAYESGPGDAVAYFPPANHDALTSLFAAANAHPRMKDVYAEYYAEWKAAGGATMIQFNDVAPWTKFGFWGALQHVTADPAASPKYRALLDFIAAHPVPAQAGAQTTGATK